MWALVITLCTGIVGSPAEKCNDHVADSLYTLRDCMTSAQKTRYTPDMVGVQCLRGQTVGSDTVADGIASEDYAG